ncbi:MAG: succinate--CoA ligase subunit alpha [Betaproteobacteria bacterium]|nr:succinate--CoA ligase subunit alpha [Betaproteobacteria bacterium]
MSILLDHDTRVIVQGITGTQGRVEAEISKNYGTHIVAGVTPGRGGENIAGIPVYDTVKEALDRHGADASLIFVPPLLVKDAVLEALDAGIRLLVGTAEDVPQHDVAIVIAAVRKVGARLVGFNTNGVISPGKARMGGLGGLDPDEVYAPGRIGLCSRSGGMCAEIGIALKQAGLGNSTAVAMGGDRITGLPMVEYVRLFEADPETDAIVLFGEPGTDNEGGVALHLRANRIRKPIVAMIAGAFQEKYPRGLSFGHAAAIIRADGESATDKKKMLADAGVLIADTLEEIPVLLKKALGH